MLFDSGEEVNMPNYKEIYWQKLATGKLWLQYCPSCQKFIFYPRSLCPYCLEPELEWKTVSGQGKVYSYTIVYVSALPEFQEEIPYIYAVIELAEGVKMPSNLVDCPLDKVHVDLPVELTFITRDGKTLPVFKPREAAF
jgi:uncharacterized OB-fold protein